MSSYNEFEQWKTNPNTHLGGVCLCTCYACYHHCELNFKAVVPLAVLKHQLHAAELKAKGTYQEQNWDGLLLHRGQNAPEKPEGFTTGLDASAKRVQQAYVYTQPTSTPMADGNKNVHFRCNCPCLNCKRHCVEVHRKQELANK